MSRVAGQHRGCGDVVDKFAQNLYVGEQTLLWVVLCGSVQGMGWSAVVEWFSGVLRCGRTAFEAVVWGFVVPSVWVWA